MNDIHNILDDDDFPNASEEEEGTARVALAIPDPDNPTRPLRRKILLQRILERLILLENFEQAFNLPPGLLELGQHLAIEHETANTVRSAIQGTVQEVDLTRIGRFFFAASSNEPDPIQEIGDVTGANIFNAAAVTDIPGNTVDIIHAAPTTRTLGVESEACTHEVVFSGLALNRQPLVVSWRMEVPNGVSSVLFEFDDGSNTATDDSNILQISSGVLQTISDGNVTDVATLPSDRFVNCIIEIYNADSSTSRDTVPMHARGVVGWHDDNGNWVHHTFNVIETGLTPAILTTHAINGSWQLAQSTAIYITNLQVWQTVLPSAAPFTTPFSLQQLNLAVQRPFEPCCGYVRGSAGQVNTLHLTEKFNVDELEVRGEQVLGPTRPTDTFELVAYGNGSQWDPDHTSTFVPAEWLTAGAVEKSGTDWPINDVSGNQVILTQTELARVFEADYLMLIFADDASIATPLPSEDHQSTYMIPRICWSAFGNLSVIHPGVADVFDDNVRAAARIPILVGSGGISVAPQGQALDRVSLRAAVAIYAGREAPIR